MICPFCRTENPPETERCSGCGRILARRSDVLPSGAVIASRYQIVSLLGKGGMGMVYKARDRMLGEDVAVKVLRREALESPEMAERFRTEIKLARAVSHKNVCRIHEYGEDHGLRYISMAFVDGEDVKNLVRREGALAAPLAFDVAIQVAEGLQAIHDEGIVHRDLKTSNLMIDRRRIVRLMDFGIAKQWGAEAATGLTAAGQIVGTPEYMSPEQIRGGQLDHRSDLYSLGIVVHELFAGRTPFASDTPIGALMRHLNEDVVLEGPGAARLPEILVPILRRALAKNAGERFASAREMADALRRARLATCGSTDTLPGETTPLGASPAEPVVGRPAASTAAPTAPGGVSTAVPAPTVVSDTVSESLPIAGTLPATARPSVARWRWLWPRLGIVAGLVAVFVFVISELGRRGGLRSPAEVPTRGSGEVSVAGSLPARSAQVPPDTAAAAAPATEKAIAQIPASPPTGAASAPVKPDRPAPGIPSRGEGGAVPLKRAPPAPLPEVSGPAAGDATPRLDRLLRQAEAAIDEGKYGVALDLYDEARKLDPSNHKAQQGYDLAKQALATAHRLSSGARAFVVGSSVAPSASPTPAGPRGFEEGGAISARRIDQAPPPPASIDIDVEPRSPRSGDPFTLKIYLVNESAAAITVTSLRLTPTINGRSAPGSVDPIARDAPPGRRVLLFTVSDGWKASTASWSLAVEVTTSRGTVFRNTVEWK